MTDSVKSPLEMFYRWEQETPDQVYLRQPSNLQWREYTWREVADQVRRIASYLREQNYPEGSRIAIWSANSKDWPIVDLAIMLAGHISVPIYPGQDVESAKYVFEHSEAKLVFVGAIDQAPSFDEAMVEGMTKVAILGCAVATDISVDTIIETIEPYTASPVPNLDDVFTIIYTSGTTGNPKGVMHMHKTPGYVVPGMVSNFKLTEPNSRCFSFLPMAHAAERIVVEMCSLYANATVSFSEGLETFAEEVRSVQPTMFFAVPRLWVKFKEGVDALLPPEAQATLSDEQKKGIAHQLGLGEAYIILTGAAPCPRDVQDWFLSMGIILRDGYGMTENFVHGCAWIKDDQPLAGCVGQPMHDSVQVRVSEQGEIQFKSMGLMKGYYKEPEKTAEVMVDGWYCTGDAGRFDEDGNLWVTGRISEVFKTAKGKFVTPSKLEVKFGRSTSIAQCCVFGHGVSQPIALVTLTETGAQQSREALQDELSALIDDINGEVDNHERVGKIVVTPEWTIDNTLLTPTMKLKRKQIEERYREQAESTPDDQRVAFVE